MIRDDIMHTLTKWIREDLGCVAGRSEFNKGRIVVNIVNTRTDVLCEYANFVAELNRKNVIACLFVLPTEESVGELPERAIDQFSRMAQIMSVLSDETPEHLVNGGYLNKVIRMACPVTNKIIDFDDFFCIAFCPQSANQKDCLYDPMMSSPFVCANLNSDVFAFSMFARDLCILKHNCEVFELDDPPTRTELFDQAAARWQAIACKTIRNYISMTNTDICPTSLASDQRYWYASHQDPAFAESRKELHRHEMPVIYTRRIIDAWTKYFETGEHPRLSDTTVPGRFVGGLAVGF